MLRTEKQQNGYGIPYDVLLLLPLHYARRISVFMPIYDTF